MLKEIRRTAAGVEYWDTEAKKVVIDIEGLAEEQESLVEEQKVVTQTDIKLDEMNGEQLLEFAKGNNINIPGNMSKEETIRKYILEELTEADK